MTDERPDDAVAFAGGAQRTGSLEDGVVTQAEIDDVLADESLSLRERTTRLAELRQRILDDEHADGDDQYVPLQARIMDALSMLAEGGHDYDGSLRIEGEENDGTPPSSPPTARPHE